MSKDRKVEVVDSREAEVDPMEKEIDLTVMLKIRENMNRRMKIKERISGNVAIPIEELLVLIEEEVILILEVGFVVIILDVVKKSIDPLSVDNLVKLNKKIEMLCFKEILRVHVLDLRLEKT